MPVADLIEAAHATYERGFLARQNDTLVTKTRNFITAVSAVFPDDVPLNRPVGNWCVLLQADINTPFDDAHVPLALFSQYVEHIYRLCLAAYAMENLALISGTQAAAVLTAWNQQFFP